METTEKTIKVGAVGGGGGLGWRRIAETDRLRPDVKSEAEPQVSLRRALAQHVKIRHPE